VISTCLLFSLLSVLAPLWNQAIFYSYLSKYLAANQSSCGDEGKRRRKEEISFETHVARQLIL